MADSFFINFRAVQPADGIPRNALLDNYVRIAAHISKAEHFTGEFWVDEAGSVVRSAHITEVPEGVRRHSVVVPEWATREGALADITAMRERVRALPPGCAVL